MVKRKNDGKEKPDSTFDIWERWDSDMLANIATLRLGAEDEGFVAGILDSLISNRRTHHMASYFPADTPGRLYSVGIQSAPKWVRNLCCHQYYDDIDMKNSGPVLLAQVITQQLGECPPEIQCYANDRESVFDAIRAEDPDYKVLSNAQLKTLFIKVTNGGHFKKDLQALNLSENMTPLRDYANRMKRCMLRLAKSNDHYRAMWAISQTKKNPRGHFVAAVYTEVEGRVLLCMKKHLEKLGFVVGALVFDGLMVEKKPDTCLLSAIHKTELYVKKKTGFEIRLLNKPMTPSAEDQARLLGEKSLLRIPSQTARIKYLVAREGQLKKYRRMDALVMGPHPTIPGVYVDIEDAKEFINHAMCGTSTGTDMKMKDIIEWFETVDDPRFPLLRTDMIHPYAVAFRDGWFNIKTREFTVWSEEVQPPLTNHFFDEGFPQDLQTPLWDNLIATQLGPRSTSADDMTMNDMFEILLGRLFFRVGELDKWQVCPYLKGSADTGKGTIFNLITRMFPISSCGTIGSTTEQTFGLESLFSKRLVMIPDAAKNFNNILPQTIFQSMVSGEMVPVPHKYGKAVTNKLWRVPIIGAGNAVLDYTDNAGSVVRRLATFPFEVPIKARNTMLQQQICDGELSKVMLRCISKYHVCIDTYGSAGFWTEIAPQAMLDVQEQVKLATNHLTAFLMQGNAKVHFEREEDKMTNMDAIVEVFEQHMKEHFPKATVPAVKYGDHFPFTNAGYEITKRKTCYKCKELASRKQCGIHYNLKNTIQIVYAKHLKIVYN